RCASAATGPALPKPRHPATDGSDARTSAWPNCRPHSLPRRHSLPIPPPASSSASCSSSGNSPKRGKSPTHHFSLAISSPAPACSSRGKAFCCMKRTADPHINSPSHHDLLRNAVARTVVARLERGVTHTLDNRDSGQTRTDFLALIVGRYRGSPYFHECRDGSDARCIRAGHGPNKWLHNRGAHFARHRSEVLHDSPRLSDPHLSTRRCAG